MKIALFALLATAGAASAAVESWSGSTSFTTDFNSPSQNINIPSFDTTGNRVLNSVTVTWCYSGSVDIAGDNDDAFKTADVRARMVRTYQGSGPGTFGFGSKTITSAVASLSVDDGDAGVFDSNLTDGISFGTLNFAPEATHTQNPNPAFYATNGAGSVAFTAQSLLMVNDQQFVGTAPDAWQLEVQNPLLTVIVKVDYDYTVIPAPGAMALLGLGGIVAGRRRR